MKTTNYYLVLIVLGFVFWSCTSTNELSDGSLKTSINKNAQNLTTAMNTISSSAGYKVLTSMEQSSNPSLVKSTTVAASVPAIDSIVLADITGVYDYKAVQYKRGWQSFTRFFTKTADDATQMIVRLPKEKVIRPWDLLHYVAADTLLTNNYVISLSDYKYRFNRLLWDYKMASTISVKDTVAGGLKIQSSNNYKTGSYHFGSEFVFANGSVAKCDYTTGDTAIATYTITDGTKTLYEEKYTAIRKINDWRHKEQSYALTIGDVQIVRTLGKNSLDSAKVYVAGVLQVNSKVEIVDAVTDSAEISVTNHKREIKITFDDGTNTTISALLGSSVETIRTLFISLRQTYFAVNVVDKIAWDIYVNKQ